MITNTSGNPLFAETLREHLQLPVKILGGLALSMLLLQGHVYNKTLIIYVRVYLMYPYLGFNLNRYTTLQIEKPRPS